MSDRRLTKLEGSLPPKTAVLRWLAEAHAFGSTGAYIGSIADRPEAHPMLHIATGLEAATTKAMRGRPRDVVGRAVRDTLREAAFLFYLVIQLNAAAEDLVQVEGLRSVAVTLWMRELTLREELTRHTDTDGWRTDAATQQRSWHAWHDAVDRLVTTLANAGEARERVEARFLAGQESRFPELEDGWRDLVRRGETLSAIGASLGHDIKGQARVTATEDAGTQVVDPATPHRFATTWVDLARAEARMFID